MTIRTRIAPSPTGSLHIGTIRTSLYDYALAKKHGGQFVIRIEDTDRKRFVEGAIETILDLHDYLGLKPDESPTVGGPYTPYVQSERLDIYKKYALQLVEQKNAYYCFCTPERLEELKNKQQSVGMAATKYDKHCMSLSDDEVNSRLENNESYVIRLNVPKDQVITWTDEVYGEISVPSNDIDDQVLIKSDGFPTYHLAVVVDDHLMNITHILRGNDWIPSTPKHILLYKYLGWEVPVHIHLPNLKEVGSNKKLSKRYGAVSLHEFLKDGYLPEALLNQLMFLGWNPGTEKELYTLEEFVADFSIERLQKTDLVSFDRNKLLWYNSHYIRNMSSEDLFSVLLKWAEKFEVELLFSTKDKEFTLKVIDTIKDRLKMLSEFNDLVSFYYLPIEVPLQSINKYASDLARAKEIIKNFTTDLSNVNHTNWNTSYLDSYCHQLLQKYGYRPKDAFMTLRLVITGREATPPLFDIMSIIGKIEVLKRLNSFLDSN